MFSSERPLLNKRSKLVPWLIFCSALSFGKSANANYIWGAYEPPQITWLTSDLPPLWINRGKLRGQGYLDLTETIIKSELSDYSHATSSLNVRRAFKYLAENDHVCSVGRVKNPEREAVAYFSEPLPKMLAQQVVMKRSRYLALVKELGANITNLSFKTLVNQHPNWTLSLVRGRSYGEAFDTVINELGSDFSSHVYWVLGRDMGESVISMLLKGRIDYTLEYPMSVNYMLTNLKSTEELMLLPVDESNSAVTGHIVCSKTRWGKQIIERINAILKTQRDAIINAHLRWIPKQQHSAFIHVQPNHSAP